MKCVFKSKLFGEEGKFTFKINAMVNYASIKFLIAAEHYFEQNKNVFFFRTNTRRVIKKRTYNNQFKMIQNIIVEILVLSWSYEMSFNVLNET